MDTQPGSASLDAINQEIDDLGLRDEVDQAAAEYEALQAPVLVPGLGFVSGLAAQMLADFSSLRMPGMTGKCYWLGESIVHVKPDCRCPRRRR